MVELLLVWTVVVSYHYVTLMFRLFALLASIVIVFLMSCHLLFFLLVSALWRKCAVVSLAHGAIQFTREPSDVGGEVGSTLVFRCGAVGEESLKVEWQVNGVVLPAEPDDEDQSIQSTRTGSGATTAIESALTISNVQISDSATPIMCLASDSSNTVLASRKVALSVFCEYSLQFTVFCNTCTLPTCTCTSYDTCTESHPLTQWCYHAESTRWHHTHDVCHLCVCMCACVCVCRCDNNIICTFFSSSGPCQNGSDVLAWD